MKYPNTTRLTGPGPVMLMAVSLILLQACGVLPKHQTQADAAKKGRVITVSSNPEGAVVRADGNKLGKTPLKVDLVKSFSRRWVKAEDYGVVYRLQGELSIEKDGCDDYTVPVTETAPTHDISVSLVCKQQQQAAQPGAPVKTVTPVAPVIPAAPAESGSVKQRLKKLDDLYRDGVISRDEYNRHRSRILGEL